MEWWLAYPFIGMLPSAMVTGMARDQRLERSHLVGQHVVTSAMMEHSNSNFKLTVGIGRWAWLGVWVLAGRWPVGHLFGETKITMSLTWGRRFLQRIGWGLYSTHVARGVSLFISFVYFEKRERKRD